MKNKELMEKLSQIRKQLPHMDDDPLWNQAEECFSDKGGDNTMIVKVYFISNATHYFPARNIKNAREIAKRVIMEGCWIINDDDSEEFYPIHTIFKVKILKQDKQGD